MSGELKYVIEIYEHDADERFLRAKVRREPDDSETVSGESMGLGGASSFGGHLDFPATIDYCRSLIEADLGKGT